MKKYLGLGLLGAVVLAGLVWTISLVVQPRLIPKIKLSAFETPVVAANSIYLRLQEEMKQNPVLFLGVEPSHPDLVGVVQQFVTMAPTAEFGYKHVLIDENLLRQVPELQGWGQETLDVQKDLSRLEAALKAAREQSVRVLVLMPAAFAASYLAGSPAAQLRERGTPVLSLLLADFARNRDGEKKLTIPCDVGERDPSGTGRLGCDIVSASRPYYRKKLKSGEMVGLMNQVSQSDFLFLITREP